MTADLHAAIAAGRTDLVFEAVSRGLPATTRDAGGVAWIRWCAYYGDVSAIRFLLEHGESLSSLGENYDINGAAFHGHWRLCQFLIESGADPRRPMPDTGETPLHAALCRREALASDRVVEVLLAAGADPNAATLPGIPTGCFMRDARTRGETPLHRAAAFGSEAVIEALLQAGANKEARDAHGDSPLSWASWHLRPAAILRRLCFGEHHVHPDSQPLSQHLLGRPLPREES